LPLPVLLLLVTMPAADLPNGMKAPGDVAEIFLPGVVSSPDDEYGLAVTRDWSEIYFTRMSGDSSSIMVIHRTDALWSAPAVTSFSRPCGASHPWLAPDGSHLYFVSRRPCPGSTQDLNVWVTERVAGGWAPPKSLGAPVTRRTVHAPSISATGTLYASGLIRLRKTATGYAEPEALKPDIQGSHPAVASDESSIVFSARRRDGLGANDLYVVFAEADGCWSEPVNLGAGVNTEAVESSPTFSVDGKYLFFSRRGDIWWVSADVVHRSRPPAAQLSNSP
jgi:hypothetical protein